ncbi:MAG: hypothetical protein J7K39_11095 [Bacteroidales bacterium]|nr:hypothetical protein [Bacteroidales bacterium]
MAKKGKRKNNPIGFSLRKISTEQFAVIEEAYLGSDKEIQLGIDLRFGLDVENKGLVAFVKVRFEQEKSPFLVVEVGNHFAIDNTAWESFQKEDKEMVLPKGFASHLVMLTIGTLRGVLHSKTENTKFNKFLLPTINVTELVKSDVELSE